MKYFCTFLFICFYCLNLSAQPKQAPKPPTAAVARPANTPKGASPYVMKKDYDSSMVKLSNQIRSVQQSVNNVQGGLSSKFQDVTTLKAQMQKVGDVLNSTNFKIDLTVDSLGKSQNSMEETQKTQESKLAQLEARLSKSESTNNILFALFAVSLVMCGAIWFMLSKKISGIESHIKNTLITMVRDQDASNQEKFNQFDQLIKKESRSNNHYSERMNAVMKDEMALLKEEIEKLKAK